MFSIHSSSSLGYTTSITKKYWCHLCHKAFSKIFIENIDIQCSYCGGTFCEELENDNRTDSNHPINFRPFDQSIRRSDRRNDITNAFFPIINRPRYYSNLLDIIINYLNMQNYEHNYENIINQIMMNDTNRYGNPPASENSIKQLKRKVLSSEDIIKFGIENTCSICRDEFKEEQEGIIMPCKHPFHNNCILSWLKERNTCPVCRFELPTDDEEYENMKNGNN